VKITHAAGYRSTAVLLGGWLASQLKWNPSAGAKSGVLRFTNSANKQISAELKEAGSEPIGEISVQAGPTTFTVKHRDGADLLEVTRHDSGEQRMNQLMPAGTNNLVSLLSDELMRGGPHAIYLRVINSVRDLI
jgi:glucose-6-phosphate dehydrogenase assembly protein OpcA